MEKIKVKIVNKSGYASPVYATPYSSGCDVKAVLDGPVTILPHSRAFFRTGLYVQLLDGWEIQVRPKSGLAKKKGILAALGTVDNDYRGEVGVNLFNNGDEPFDVFPGDKIAQLVIAQVFQIEWEEVESLDETERGEGGFGSTGR